MELSSIKLANAYSTNDEHKKYKSKNQSVEIKTTLNFLKQHNGLRKNKMGLFLAPTGVGKSTMVRTMARDFIVSNPDKKLFLWLTEETSEEFRSEFSFCIPEIEQAKNITIFSEADNYKLEESVIFEMLELMLNEEPHDLILIDNLTTSKIYQSKKPADQSDIAIKLKGYLAQYSVSLFIIAHTGADVRSNQTRLIDENDVKGSKYITTITEFLYILQPVYVNNEIFQFVSIKKHRGQQCDQKLFFLKYDKILKSFSSDQPRNFEDFKELFKDRNQLK